MSTFDTAIDDIKREREKQDKRWGDQNHGPSRWSDILMEEVGEVSRAILEHCGPSMVMDCNTDLIPFSPQGEQAVRAELVQVAAVAVAWIECIDRRATND